MGNPIYRPNLDHFQDSNELPQLYWDVMTAEQRIHAICQLLEDTCADLVGVHGELDQAKADIKKLGELFQEFIDSGFDDYYSEQVKKWIDEHLRYIFEHVAKQIYFGLTSDGYFCAYIPDGWKDIMFDTGMVYGAPSYGRLILRYDVDGARGVIDNTGYGEGIGLDVASELEAKIARLNMTCYTKIKDGE